MKNKYQEAIKELKDFVHSELDGTRMLEEYLKHCDTLQELVDKEQDYTLEEIKKMWEDAGYVWVEKRTRFQLEIHLLAECSEIIIYTNSKMYECIDRDTDELVQPITSQEHQLLTKTFKALGWE